MQNAIYPDSLTLMSFIGQPFWRKTIHHNYRFVVLIILFLVWTENLLEIHKRKVKRLSTGRLRLAVFFPHFRRFVSYLQNWPVASHATS